KPVLGILFPSACFEERTPQGGVLYSYFLGGMRHPELVKKSDAEVAEVIRTTLHEMLNYPTDVTPDLIRIFRHERAIPQYDCSSADRLTTIDVLQKQYPGLVLAGNIKGGIGMADRIKQAVGIALEG
ncbi:MAG: FAD-dependent oxidoreductase, partial [Bacteroides sp.]